MRNELKWPNEYRSFDELGDMCKQYEKIKTDTLIPNLPVMCRLDGRAFHTFTRGLNRPFDENLTTCMQETMLNVCEKFHADLGYCQSDEITLFWHSLNIFDGKVEKILSLLAAQATAKFNGLLPSLLPTKVDSLPVFDARLWQVPNDQQVFNTFLWRWMDAKKNSVSMYASSHFSVKELNGKKTRDRKEMLLSKGLSWDNLDNKFKYGSMCKKVEVLHTAINPKTNVEETTTRRKYKVIDVPEYTSIYNLQFNNKFRENELEVEYINSLFLDKSIKDYKLLPITDKDLSNELHSYYSENFKCYDIAFDLYCDNKNLSSFTYKDDEYTITYAIGKDGSFEGFGRIYKHIEIV